jgi:hypothetical protein
MDARMMRELYFLQQLEQLCHLVGAVLCRAGLDPAKTLAALEMPTADEEGSLRPLRRLVSVLLSHFGVDEAELTQALEQAGGGLSELDPASEGLIELSYLVAALLSSSGLTEAEIADALETAHDAASFAEESKPSWVARPLGAHDEPKGMWRGRAELLRRKIEGWRDNSLADGRIHLSTRGAR